MAQWIPKTSWRLSNLNKLYGLSEIGLHNADKTQHVYKAGKQVPLPFLAVPVRPVPSAFRRKGNGAAAAGDDDFSQLRAMLKTAYDAEVPFLDLRDEYDINQSGGPLKKALVLHHHDLLSGACNDILPQDRKNAHIVLIASSNQRAVNGFKALKRWGFDSVVVTDGEAVAGLDSPAVPEGKTRQAQK